MQGRSAAGNFVPMQFYRIFSFCLFVLLSMACGGPKRDRDDRTVFRFNIASGVTSLDPAFAKDQSHNWVCQQLYDGLVELDSALLVRPSIASSWEVRDSGRTYCFTLRNDIYFNEFQYNKIISRKSDSWHFDGRKVVASDVAFSLNRLTDQTVASPGAWVMASVEQDSTGRLTGISVPNDTTLVIRLKHPFPPFLSLLAMPYCSVVPREVVDRFGKDFRDHPCGTGPFKLAFWKEGVRLIFHRNEHYFGRLNGRRLPFLDAIEISFIEDKQSAFIEFLKGNLDLISGLDPSFKDELLTPLGSLQSRHHGKFKLETLPYLNTEYLGFMIDPTTPGGKDSPFLHKEVRQALNLGFDRKSMMLYLRNNMGTPGIFGFVPPGLPSFSADTTIGYDYDPAAARRLLRAAGYPDGKGLPPIVLSTTSTYLDLCENIKSQWEDLGVDVKIDVNQAAVHRKMVAEQKLSFFRGSWIADYPDAENYLSLFYSPNAAPAGPNYTHYANAEFDRLYREAATAPTDSIRFARYREMDRLVMQDAPVIVLYYDKVVRLLSNRVSGLPANAMNMLQLKYASK